MLIDWWTVGAQVVNFLILAALLKFVLFDRITRALDARQKRLEDAQQAAEDKARTAEEEAASLRKEREALEKERQDKLREAQEAAEARRKELTEKAQDEVAQLRERWKQSVHDEEERFLAQLRHQAGQSITGIARKALGDMADAELEAQMVQVFLRRLDALEDTGREALLKAFDEEKNTVTVTSAFALDDKQQEQIAKAVQGLRKDVQLRFDQDEDVLCGIEIRAGGRAVGWTLDGYLEELREAVAQGFPEETG